MLTTAVLVGLAGATGLVAAAPPKELTTADLVERARPSVVVIHAATRTGVSTGTGFIVGDDGLVATNLHVVADATAVSIKCTNGAVYDEVALRAVDEERDLALLQVPGTNLPALSLAGVAPPRLGSRAVIIGNPLGVLEWSVSVGVISAVRPVSPSLSLIQSDVKAKPGNSGGPLLDEDGNVAGVVTSKIMRAEGLTFAVPAEYVRQLLASKGDPIRLRRYLEQPSNTPAGQAPKQGAKRPTARCRDGSFSYAKHHTGACSGHGGVSEWLGGN